jgi:hypothetical protein
MNDTKDKAVGMLLGVAVAAVLTVCAFGLYMLAVHFFPSITEHRVPWISWLTVIALPEAIFITAVVVFWRKRRAMAIGILISAMVLGTHFILHVARLWGG